MAVPFSSQQDGYLIFYFDHASVPSSLLSSIQMMSGLRPRFDSSPEQLWYLESPANVTVNLAVDIQANDTTLNPASIEDLHINVWLLRTDFSSDADVATHDPALLASDQLTVDFEIIWTPTVNDVDVGIPEAGIHQIAWEDGDNNLALDPKNTSFIGVSKVFNVLPDNVNAEASASASALEASASALLFPSDTAAATLPGSALGTTTVKGSGISLPGTALSSSTKAKSTTTPQTLPGTSSLSSTHTSTYVLPGTSISAEASSSPNTSPSKPGNNSIIIGLTVSLILILLIGAAGAFWGLRFYRRRNRRGSLVEQKEQEAKPEDGATERAEVPEIGGKPLPVEMSSLQSRLHELGMAEPIELPAGEPGHGWGGGQETWRGR